VHRAHVRHAQLVALHRFESRRSLPRETGRSNLLPCSCWVRAGVSPEIVSKVTYLRQSRKIVSTHFTFHACSKNASFPRSSSNCHFDLNVSSALSVVSRMGSSTSSPVVGTCVLRAGTGAASLAACTNTCEADSAGVRGLARVALCLLGLCNTSKGSVYGRRLVFVSERTNKRHHHHVLVRETLLIGHARWIHEGQFVIKDLDLLVVRDLSVLGIQTLTRGEVAWHPRGKCSTRPARRWTYL
jgi:hypothetical protein